MKRIGITRVRNEEIILQSTLDRLSNHLDGVIAFDDCSTDGTRDILNSHPLVIDTLFNPSWDSDPEKRKILETSQRQSLYDYTRQNYNPDWVLYFDADEHFYFDEIDWDSNHFYYFRLFDVYITPEDVNEHFIARNWIGKEYRDIPMLFRPNQVQRFYNRVPIFNGSSVYPQQVSARLAGTVKHFGKGISVEHWEETCDYYINHLNERMPDGRNISDKWRERKGKAVHKYRSDFGLPLIKWNERYQQKKIVALKDVEK